MKRVIALCVIAIVSLGGCTSTGFLGFLATTEYVNTKDAEVSAETQRLMQEEQAALAEIRSDVEELKTLREETQKSIALVAETQATVDELQALAAAVEQRIATMPAETLQKLVEILQTFLSQQAPQP